MIMGSVRPISNYVFLVDCYICVALFCSMLRFSLYLIIVHLLINWSCNMIYMYLSTRTVLSLTCARTSSVLKVPTLSMKC